MAQSNHKRGTGLVYRYEGSKLVDEIAQVDYIGRSVEINLHRERQFSPDEARRIAVEILIAADQAEGV